MSERDDSGFAELNRRRFVQATGAGVAGLAAGVPIAKGDYQASWENPDDVLKVLYLGGVEDAATHYSEIFLQEITEYFLLRGIEAHYTERQDDLNSETLSNYDAVMLFGNRLDATEEQIDALENFVEDGGGFVPVHSASASFTGDFGDTPDDLAERYISLVGGAFDTHNEGEMSTDRVDHPIFEGVDEIEAFEETYRHYDIADDIEVLATATGADFEEDEEEPFTWVREQGDGRVFYTAWGHGIFGEVESYEEGREEMNVWTEPGFRQLLENGIRWASGNEDAIGGDHPTLEDIEYSSVEDYGHEEVPYYHNGAPDRVSSEDDGTWDLVQDPMDVPDSLAHTITPAEFEMEYFVSEETLPEGIEGQILDMTFDAAGRCWISVTQDYPNDAGAGNDSIVICEDTDGDGIADDFTVFAEGLSIPHSIIAYGDGVLMAEAQSFEENAGRIAYLADTDGDDVADVEETLFTGYGTGDTHAGVNQLWYGHDNWVYGVVGYSGLVPSIDEELELNQDLFRFKPGCEEIEFVGSGASNMAGVKTNEEGLVFCSSATAGDNVTTYAAIPAAYYDYINEYEGHTTVDVRGENHSRINWENRALPVNGRYRAVENIGGFTAASDQEFYTAREFPEQYWNRTIFVGEGTAQLLATYYVEQDGAGYTSVNHNNLVSSNDEWVSPTYANTGPDGMVWMIDFYNYIFQHNPTPDGYENGPGNAYETNVREQGKAYSRLYRVTTGDDVDLHANDLREAESDELVEALSDDNMFWRLTAQRKLVERCETDVVDDLVALLEAGNTDELGLDPGAIHAIWTLDGLGVLEEDGERSDESAIEAVRGALSHESAGVRLTALRVLPGDETLRDAILENDLLQDEDGRVQMWALLKLAETPESEEVGAAVFELIIQEEHYEDDLLVEAASVAGATHSQGFIDAYEAEVDQTENGEDEEGENLLPNPSFEETEEAAGAAEWDTQTWAGEAEFALDDEETYSGEQSARIDSEDGIDGAWHQTVEVEPNTEYTLSGAIRTEELDEGSGYGAQFNVHELGEESLTDAVTGTSDWVETSVTVDSGDNEQLQINALMGGFGESTGTAWFDDVSFEGPDGENLLANGGFEEGGVETQPAAWTTDEWAGPVEHTHTDEAANDGEYSVRLHSEDSADAAWSQHGVEVEPNAEYRVSGYARTEDVDEGSGYGAVIGIGGLGHIDAEEQRTDALTGTEDWTELSWEFETQTTEQIAVHAMIGWHGESSGTIWYDDLELVQTSAPAPGYQRVYDRVVNHVEAEEGGGDEETGEQTEGIEPGTQIEFDGQTSGWVGLSPDSIADEENPTLTLQEGETYEIGWTEGDGSIHNVAIWNDDDETVDDLVTELVDDPGDGQWLEFEASSEMAVYICEAHVNSMVGDIEIVSDGGDAEDGDDTEDGENGTEDGENGTEDDGNGNETESNDNETETNGNGGESVNGENGGNTTENTTDGGNTTE